jgi:hypothetical protein
MESPAIGRTCSRTQRQSGDLRRFIRLCCTVLLPLMAAIPAAGWSQTQQPAKPAGVEPAPEPAVSAILAAFDTYEVVGMPEAHGMKDLDDFILSLIRNPAFPEKVNDIAVECGNSLYQPELDRYIAGEDVSFAAVRKAWRNTTQPMCGMSGFFEQFFPLVRAINQKLPPERRLRVLAGDPPIDWEQVKTFQEMSTFLRRDASIAAVMEKEVLSKHRKALMLFGTFHLMHGMGAVAIYEKDYPDVTFVISELGIFDTDLSRLSASPFASWPIPSLARAKGTWLGALDSAHFFPAPLRIDKECNIQNELPKELQKPMESLVEAFLYLGPQDLRLGEQIPADIVLDDGYMRELQRRPGIPGLLGAGAGMRSAEFNRQIVDGAEDPLFRLPKHLDTRAAVDDPFVKDCLARKSHDNAPQ